MLKLVLAVAFAAGAIVAPAQAEKYRIAFEGVTTSASPMCGIGVPCTSITTPTPFSGWYDYDSTFSSPVVSPLARISISSPIFQAIGVTTDYSAQLLNNPTFAVTPTSMNISSQFPTFTLRATVTNGVVPGVPAFPFPQRLSTDMQLQSGTFSFTQFISSGGSGARFNGTLSSLSIVDMAAVPEPATWLMFIAGFGALAAVLRRTRKPAAMAIA